MRRLSSTLLVVVGALIVVVGGFLPWGASGRAERNSYALVGVADRLEVVDGVAAGVARLWYLSPLVAAAVWLAASLGRHRTAALLAGVLGAGGLALAVAVRASPVLDRPGVYVTICGVGVIAVGLVLAVAERGRNDTR